MDEAIPSIKTDKLIALIQKFPGSRVYSYSCELTEIVIVDKNHIELGRLSVDDEPSLFHKKDPMSPDIRVKVYDPRDQRYKQSKNPALLFGELVRAGNAGLGVDTEETDDSEFWQRVGYLADCCDKVAGWIPEPPTEAGTYWFRGKVLDRHGSWEKVEETMVEVGFKLTEPRVYLPKGEGTYPKVRVVFHSQSSKASGTALRPPLYVNLGGRKMAACAIQMQEEILCTMQDLSESATDTVWVTETETMFDRLTELYLLAGGNLQRLQELWPEYLGFNETH